MVADAIIIGGGPAGLSAALVLARCRRNVIVIDAGHTRNAAARHMHNYLTRDGVPPREFRRLARAELRNLGVRTLNATAVDAARNRDGLFTIRLASGRELRSRALLLATGVVDVLPQVPGFDTLYGRTIHHCPYCDGYPYADKRLAAYGKGRAAIGLAMLLKQWTDDVIACTDGEPLTAADRARAKRHGIALRESRVTRFEGRAGRLRRVHFSRGEPLDRDGLFFNTGQVQRSGLAAKLKCEFKDNGGIRTDRRQCAGMPGLYVAGDADREVQFVVVAASQGATAGTAINQDLLRRFPGAPRARVSANSR